MTMMIAAVCAALSIGQAEGTTTDPVELVKQGRSLVTQGRIDEGLALYTKAIAAKPDLFDAHLAAGIALDLKLRFADARTHLGHALELATDENRNQVLSALAVSYAFEGKARDAAGFYQQQIDAQTAAGNYGAAAATANALGRVYLETGNTVDARRWYETGYEYAKRQPDTPGAQLKLWHFRWLHAQGRIAARSGRLDEARARVAEARALIDSAPELKDQEPTWQYLAGYVALLSKDHRSAIDALRQADARDPFVQALLAEAYTAVGKTEEARDAWTRVVQSSAHNLQNAFARPKALKALGK